LFQLRWPAAAFAEKQNTAAWGELACRVGKSALRKKGVFVTFCAQKVRKEKINFYQILQGL
jgi:hypothetical protein